MAIPASHADPIPTEASSIGRAQQAATPKPAAIPPRVRDAVPNPFGECGLEEGSDMATP
ncbi:hypothetical protein [uncultured Bradyrhizobium sp.]|jgi:hypothetical protein|uniref:hypothetical protein n=1 Tax=uncultured Bradyrhizobium sp. TaxID=199684 RepID=UPI0026140F6B|nr:hypothetical protein [uncultured Bradyrhizobium sp.]